MTLPRPKYPFAYFWSIIEDTEYETIKRAKFKHKRITKEYDINKWRVDTNGR